MLRSSYPGIPGRSALFLTFCTGLAALTSLGAVCTAVAQPPAARGPADFYYEHERYPPYAAFDDDQFVDYDDFYYDEYYEARAENIDYEYEWRDYDDVRAYGLGNGYGYGEGYYDDFGVYDDNAYFEADFYDDFGYGGYARHGYGYEGFTYDYYDDARIGYDVYGGEFEYGVDDDWYYSEDLAEEAAAMEMLYD